MRFSNSVQFHRQVRFLRRQFLQSGDLPFTEVLSRETISGALTTAEVVWKHRIYTPLVSERYKTDVLTCSLKHFV